MRWEPPLGALGAATGAIAIGTAATSTLTTTIISIRIIISTATSAAKGKVTGNTIRNIAEMHPMVIEEPRTSSVAMRVSSRAAELAIARGAPAEPVVRVGLVELAA